MQETFSSYFDTDSSIAASGASLHETLATIAGRYMGQNPPGAYRFRAFRTDSFIAQTDGTYDLDLNSKLPEAINGQYALIAAKFHKPKAEIHTVLLSCYSKLDFYFNGKLVWQSSAREENISEIITPIDLQCDEGWNTLLFCCRKTTSGFGCGFGPQMPNWRWLSFLAPFGERYGQGGFVYTNAFNFGDIDPAAIDLCGQESDIKTKWYPEMQAGEAEIGKLNSLFGDAADKWAAAWTTLEQKLHGERKIKFDFSGADFYLDGQKLECGETTLAGGDYDLLAVSKCPADKEWAFAFSAKYEDGTSLALSTPRLVSGTNSPYLYLGPLDEEPDFKIPTLYGLFGQSSKCYWRSGKFTVIRPYLENECFGRWNYPLGVTLYGLTQTSRVLKRTDIFSYVERHIRECVSLHDYSLWDAKEYGFPEMNNQIAALKSLDDCGSFGSAMLECHKDKMNTQVHAVADRISEHIFNKQERREDGAFYREAGDHATMWVDDLYMSIPFLCRYYKLSGNMQYLDDAAKQVLLFKKYLFMPDSNIMSHVYDFRYNTDTKVPWGRGNGWCLFSTSELLEHLPEDHPKRPEIISFFSKLCEGYLKLQGSRGLWHQVLTHTESYEESSCTAMFTYAFCRAVRLGWVNEELADRLMIAARKAWYGLCSISVDRFGNVYGICRGSYYSFSPEYYRDVLGWVLNDTHGTGIVLLAGIELEKVLREGGE